jgi:hypothetical protein
MPSSKVNSLLAVCRCEPMFTPERCMRQDALGCRCMPQPFNRLERQRSLARPSTVTDAHITDVQSVVCMCFINPAYRSSAHTGSHTSCESRLFSRCALGLLHALFARHSVAYTHTSVVLWCRAVVAALRSYMRTALRAPLDLLQSWISPSASTTRLLHQPCDVGPSLECVCVCLRDFALP